MTVMNGVLALLLATGVSARAALPRIPAAGVRAPLSAPVSGASASPFVLAPPALAAGFLPAAAIPQLRMSRDVARDDAADRLEAAGFPAELAAHGLTMWHVLSHVPRSGEQLHLTFGLPPDGRPFERGGGDPERRAELARRMKAAEARIIARAAEILGKDPSVFVLHERLVEGCCGAGCQSCLLGNPERTKKWTGLSRGPSR